MHTPIDMICPPKRNRARKLYCKAWEVTKSGGVLDCYCILVLMQTVQDIESLSLDPQGDRPLYLQVVEQIERRVATGALQPGEHLPPVRALAARLGINAGTVARAYADLERAGVIATRRGGGSSVSSGSRDARLAAVREERLRGIVGRAALDALSLGYSPEDIAAAFTLQTARWREGRQVPQAEPGIASTATDINTIVLTGSHDLTLDLLAGYLRRRAPEMVLSITSVGSLGGLIALEREEAHIAGAHLLDEETGDYNIPFVKRLLPGQGVVLVTLAHRHQGLIVGPGNPKGIEGLEDLRQPGIRYVNRQRGSGTRVLLDYSTRQVGILPDEIQGYDHEVDTHVAVAAAVAGGHADAGLGIYGAARAFGLGFVSLVRERYDLVIPRRHYDGRAVQTLLETIGDDEFKRVVQAVGGYDTADTGRVIVVS